MSDSVKRESGSIEMRGAPLYYEVAGAGSTLVLLHEGIADCRMYDDQFEAIARQHQVVRYDFHGFGRSGTPTEPYTHHEGLRSLLEHLGIDRAGILGMSLGGSVALDFALTYPARVDALLLLAAGIGGYPPSDSSATLFAPVVEAYQTGDVAKGIERMVAIWVDGMERRPEEVDPIVRERVREMYTAVLRRTREGERSADALDPPAYRRLADIHVPTLVAVGSGDVPDVIAQADLLARTIPGAHKIMLPRLGHVFNMERPAEVNQIILDFLASAI